MEPGLPCAVCGGLITGFHYGAIVCSCCRVFFLRQTRRLKPPMCKDSNSCKIVSGSHSNCQSCRYKKCLAIGMNPKEVDQTQVIKKQLAVSKLIREKMNFTFDRITQSTSAGFSFIFFLKSTSSSLEFSRSLLHLERQIQNVDAPTIYEVQPNVQVSLADALINSQLSCPRYWPFGNWSTEGPTSIRLVHCRTITYYLDFVTSIEEIHKIHGIDRLKLIQSNYIFFGLMTYFYDTWRKKVEEKVLIRRTIRYNLPEREQNIMSKMVQQILKVKNHLTKSIERINWLPEEVVILKMIAVFTPPINLSDSSHNLIQNARTKYTILFGNLIHELYPDLEFESVMKRVRDSLEILRLIKEGSDCILQPYRELFVCNADGLAGSLTYDMYMREY